MFQVRSNSDDGFLKFDAQVDDAQAARLLFSRLLTYPGDVVELLRDGQQVEQREHSEATDARVALFGRRLGN